MALSCYIHKAYIACYCIDTEKPQRYVDSVFCSQNVDSLNAT